MSSTLNFSEYQSSAVSTGINAISSGSKKRISTLGKPNLAAAAAPTAGASYSPTPAITSAASTDKSSEFDKEDDVEEFESSTNTNTNDDRAARMNQLIMEHTAPQTDERMGNFTPLEPPKLSRLPIQDAATGTSSGDLSSYRPITSTDENYSNYRYVYDSPQTIPAYSGYYSQRARRQAPPPLTDMSRRDMDKIWERLNYMTILLEEQHNERTRFVTEEFVLYTFLGIFMIYIVDGFSRSGKYVRGE
jgi:hypothetical protein